MYVGAYPGSIGTQAMLSVMTQDRKVQKGLISLLYWIKPQKGVGEDPKNYVR